MQQRCVRMPTCGPQTENYRLSEKCPPRNSKHSALSVTVQPNSLQTELLKDKQPHISDIRHQHSCSGFLKSGGFYQLVQSICKTTDSKAVFMQCLVLYFVNKLRSSYNQQMSFRQLPLTVSVNVQTRTFKLTNTRQQPRKMYTEAQKNQPNKMASVKTAKSKQQLNNNTDKT